MPDTDTYWGCAYCGADLTHERHRNTCPNCDEPMKGRWINIEREVREANKKPSSPRNSTIIWVEFFHRRSRTKVRVGIDEVKWRKATRGNVGSQNSIMVGQVLPALKKANRHVSSSMWDDCDHKVVKGLSE